MVEHTAVNRGVVGSSPTRGGIKPVGVLLLQVFFKRFSIFVCIIVDSFLSMNKIQIITFSRSEVY